MVETVKLTEEEFGQALSEMDDDSLLAYHRTVKGLTDLEAKLPATCTEENQDAIGKVIKRSAAAEKFAGEAFHGVVAEWNAKIERQRGMWKPLVDRAKALRAKGIELVNGLLLAQAEKRRLEELAARDTAKAAAKKLADAEAASLAASTPQEAEAAKVAGDAAWEETRTAVAALDKGPVQTAVKVGDATVYESQNLDFTITDMGAFATAHPDLVEVKRGPTLAGLRDAVKGLPELPKTVAGWPGVELSTKKSPRSR